jgi:uncharacterized membrane protein
VKRIPPRIGTKNCRGISHTPLPALNRRKKLGMGANYFFPDIDSFFGLLGGGPFTSIFGIFILFGDSVDHAVIRFVRNQEQIKPQYRGRPKRRYP